MCGTNPQSPTAHCPGCGSFVRDLIDGICPACFLGTRQVLRISPFQIAVCPECLRYKHQNSWREGGVDLRSTIIKAVEAELPRRARLTDQFAGSRQGPARHPPTILHMWVERPSVMKKKVALDICAEVGPLGEQGETAKVCMRSTVPFQRRTCRECGLKGSEFYSCTLQVRAERRDLDREEIEWITSLVKEASGTGSKDRMGFLSKVDDVRQGRDFYLGSVKRARDIARKAVRQRGGTIEESKKLVGVQKGSNRKLYKFTILLRLLGLQPGDITEHNGRTYVVQHVQGTRVALLGLDGRTVCVEGTAAKDLPVLAKRRDVGDAIVTEVRPDGIQILDPRSNLTFDLDQRPAQAKVGSTIRVMWIEGVPKPVPSLSAEAEP